MKNSQIASEIKLIAKQKSLNMPLGTFSRLKVNNEISDFVIQTSSSGIWFFNEPNPISKNITEKIIGFVYYKDLN